MKTWLQKWQTTSVLASAVTALFLSAPVSSQELTGPATGDTKATDSPNGDLSLAQALELTLARDPALKSAIIEIRAKEAEGEQAVTRPNPEFSISAENLAGSGVYQGVDRLETTFSLSQRVDLVGGREARLRRSTNATMLAKHDFEIVKAETLALTKAAFVEVLVAQDSVQLEEEAVKASQQLEGMVARRARAGGGGSPAEVINARMDVAKAQLRLEQAKGRLSMARSRLALRWGSTTPTFTRAAGSLQIPQEMPAYELLVQRLDQSLETAKWQAEQAMRQSNVGVEEAKGRSDLTLSGGVKHFQEESGVALVVGASVPVPFFDNNRGGIREAREQVARSITDQESAKLRASDALTRVYQQLSMVQREVRSLDEVLIPKSKAAYSAVMRGYRIGSSNYLELGTAQKMMFELRTRRLEVAGEFHRSFAELHRITTPAS